MKTIASDSVRVQIARPEIDHLDFGDAGMLNAALDERALRGKERTLIITRQAVLTFFNRHLKADSRYDLERLQADFPEVKIVRFRGGEDSVDCSSSVDGCIGGSAAHKVLCSRQVFSNRRAAAVGHWTYNGLPVNLTVAPGGLRQIR
jgi:hypothetical protein